MGQAYYVIGNLRFKNGDPKEFCEIVRKEMVDTWNFSDVPTGNDPLEYVKILVKNKFYNYKNKDGILTFDSDLYGTYSWGGVLYDVFTKGLDACDEESFVMIDDDGGLYTLFNDEGMKLDLKRKEMQEEEKKKKFLAECEERERAEEEERKRIADEYKTFDDKTKSLISDIAKYVQEYGREKTDNGSYNVYFGYVAKEFGIDMETMRKLAPHVNNEFDLEIVCDSCLCHDDYFSMGYYLAYCPNFYDEFGELEEEDE